jgi:hypothetical protein
MLTQSNQLATTFRELDSRCRPPFTSFTSMNMHRIYTLRTDAWSRALVHCTGVVAVGLVLSALSPNRNLSAQSPIKTSTVSLTRPGDVPALFAAGTVSTMFDEWNTSFGPDGHTVFFSRGRFWTIMTSRSVKTTWSVPQVASFSGRWLDTDPFVSPDGKRVYFVSNRPLDGRPTSPPLSSFGIWYVEQVSGGGWSRPINVGPGINGHGSVWFPAVTNNGTLYFHAQRADGKGSSDIYFARWAGDHYADPVLVDLNTAASEQEAYVAPDESYMIFVSDRANGFGSGDLYISTRRDGHWETPMNLGQPINSYSTDMAPSVSPDGTTLYLTSGRQPFRGARPDRVDAASFLKEVSGYANGSLKMYSIALDTLALRHFRESRGGSISGA